MYYIELEGLAKGRCNSPPHRCAILLDFPVPLYRHRVASTVFIKGMVKKTCYIYIYGSLKSV